MSAFCSNCGFPLAASNSFCPKCGARLMPQTAPPPAASMVQPAPQPMAPPPAARSGSGLKIVLVVLGVIAVFGVIAIAGTVYAVHRVKQAVVKTAESHGVDLNRISSDLESAAASPSHSSAPPRKTCDYLSKDQVSNLIGEPIDHVVADGESCQYFGPPGLAARLGKEGMNTGMQQLQNDKKGNAQVAQALNNLINGMGSQTGEDRPLLMVAIDPDGKAQMTALDVAGGLFGGIPGAKPEEISGLGDRAVRFANLGLNVLKGSTVARIVAGPIPDPDAKTLAVAKALVPML